MEDKSLRLAQTSLQITRRVGQLHCQLIYMDSGVVERLDEEQLSELTLRVVEQRSAYSRDHF